MIGYILYETIEMVYYVTKLTYNGVKNTYNWYYNIDEIPYNNTIQMTEINNTILLLNKKCYDLEKKLDYQNKIISNYVDNNIITAKKQLLLTYEN